MSSIFKFTNCTPHALNFYPFQDATDPNPVLPAPTWTLPENPNMLMRVSSGSSEFCLGKVDGKVSVFPFVQPTQFMNNFKNFDAAFKPVVSMDVMNLLTRYNTSSQKVVYCVSSGKGAILDPNTKRVRGTTALSRHLLPPPVSPETSTGAPNSSSQLDRSETPFALASADIVNLSGSDLCLYDSDKCTKVATIPARGSVMLDETLGEQVDSTAEQIPILKPSRYDISKKSDEQLKKAPKGSFLLFNSVTAQAFTAAKLSLIEENGLKILSPDFGPDHAVRGQNNEVIGTCGLIYHPPQ